MCFLKNNTKQKPFAYCHICQRALDGFTTVCPYCGHPIMN